MSNALMLACQVASQASPEMTPPRMIRASEVGRYAFCARAWWLQYIQGCSPQNVEALSRGLEGHAAHGRMTRSARRLLAMAYGLLMIAAILGGFLIIVSVAR